jgi:signal transduction histidine kinase
VTTTAPSAVDPLAAAPSGGVLVVDDDEGMRETLVEVLSTNGIDAEGVGSAAAARIRHEQLVPAVMIVDHRLPDANGIDLGSLLKQRDPDLTVLLLTGYASLENAIAAVGQLDGYLTKPVPPAELVRSVRIGLESARLRRQNRSLVDQLRQTNLMLEQNVNERTTELTGLLTMAEAVAASNELGEVVEACLRAASAVTEAGYAGLYLTEDEGGWLRLQATFGDAALPERLELAGDGSVVGPIGPDGDRPHVVPLGAGGRQVGVVVLGSAKPTKAMFRATLAASAAIAIQNAQRFARERETSERLSELSRMKTTFLASVSHELRTPLTAVVGFADLLRKNLETLPSEQRTQLVDQICEQGNRLRALVEDILDAARAEFGGLRVALAAQDVAEVASRVQASFEGATSPVVLQIAPELPLVNADEARLEQILSNLVANAIKHSPDGSPVEIRGAPEGDDVLVSVVDSGKGIEPAFLAQLFEPFTQAAGTGGRSDGLGLGLYIVRGLVEAMGGTIEVQSRVGEGSEFVIRLRRASVQTGPGE